MTSRSRHNLDEIVSKLCEGKQRATYGAVAELLGVPAPSLMNRRPKSHTDSWVVASASGVPTGYDDTAMDPDCLQQIRAGERHFISDARTVVPVKLECQDLQ